MVEIEKKDLEVKIFEEKLSYEEIGRIYGCSGGYIRKYAKKIGIELPKRRLISENETFNKGKRSNRCIVCGKEIPYQGKYCSKECQNYCQQTIFIKKWKSGEENGVVGEYGISRRIRNFLFQKYECRCQICGWHEVNPYTGNVPLEVHHIDGDYTNNNESNLQLLCPNCHSLTETFKNHNKSGREGRRKKLKNEDKK